jgi:glycosyltransferase involved in cell wall biosynthesis
MIIPINFLSKGPLYRTLLKFNGWLVRRTIRRYLKRLQMEQDLINIVSFNPAMGLVNGKRFHERLLLYLCYDEISAAPYLKQHGAWLEKEFMKKADAVIVTSQGLYERKSPMARSCFLVKNAANIQLFSTAFSPENPPKKQVGFIGSIDDRLDYELLEYVIQGMPDTEFIFIGRVMDKKGESLLRKLDNVIFTGPKSLQELPNYVRHFSAGIIPFAKTEFTKGIYPLKINEYLAAGVPVVTTNFSYLNDFEQVVSIAENKEAFKQMLANEISNDSLEKKLARQAVARENTWERRGEELSAIIEELEKFKI